MPLPSVTTLLADHFVALAADADAPEAPVVELGAKHLADAMMLPFVLLVDAKGAWLGGGHGQVKPNDFVAKLQLVIE